MSRHNNVIIAGFGGQGVMLIGNLLAQAGMEAGLNVTFIPVYGAEMRGGTANCTVVMDDDPIGSPIVRRPMAVIALNQPSLDKFQPTLAENGALIVNTSLIEPAGVSKNVRTTLIPANDLAHEVGTVKMANMIALGAYLKASGALPLSAAQKALEQVISKHYAKLIPQNARALEVGYNFEN